MSSRRPRLFFFFGFLAFFALRPCLPAGAGAGLLRHAGGRPARCGVAGRRPPSTGWHSLRCVGTLLSRTLLGRTLLSWTLLGRALLGRALLGRALLGRTLLGRALLGRTLLRRDAAA